MSELLLSPGALGALFLAMLIFGFAPGIFLAAIVRLIPDIDRRKELQAELYVIPYWKRPLWVAEQFEVALRTGLPVHLEWFWGRYVWHRSSVTCGLDRHLASPETFEIPDSKDKDLVRPGDFVKLMWEVERSPGERMWVKVISRNGNRLVGTLENYAICAYLKAGERIKFDIDDIIDLDFCDSEEIA